VEGAVADATSNPVLEPGRGTPGPLLAYWVCMTAAATIRCPEDLDGFPEAMRRRHGRGTAGLTADPTQTANGLYRPLAPVALSRDWAPLPELREVFGPPSLKRDQLIEGNRVTTVWFSPASLMRASDLQGACRESKRAAELFRGARHRAAALGSGLVVVSWPGWREPVGGP